MRSLAFCSRDCGARNGASNKEVPSLGLKRFNIARNRPHFYSACLLSSDELHVNWVFNLSTSALVTQRLGTNRPSEDLPLAMPSKSQWQGPIVVPTPRCETPGTEKSSSIYSRRREQVRRAQRYPIYPLHQFASRAKFLMSLDQEPPSPPERIRQVDGR